MTTAEGQALVLQVGLLGETQRLLTVFSATQGRLRGALRGLKTKPCQALDGISYRHYRRLDSQLGTFDLEIEQTRAGWWLAGGTSLLMVNWLVELLLGVLPDEQPYPALYQEILRLLDQGPDSGEALWRRVVRLELLLLQEVGYGLSLAEDAVRETAGDMTPLLYVSPNSGRAISAKMGAPYADRLLPLPASLGGPAQDEAADRLAALQVTGHFVKQAVHGRTLDARRRLVQALTET